MTPKEAIAELKKVDTLDMPARLCEAHYMAINALKKEAEIYELIHTPARVQVDTIKRGHWIDRTSGYAFNDECSECGYIVHIQFIKEYQFCPNCGARMFEPQESEEL